MTSDIYLRTTPWASPSTIFGGSGGASCTRQLARASFWPLAARTMQRSICVALHHQSSSPSSSSSSSSSSSISWLLLCLACPLLLLHAGAFDHIACAGVSSVSSEDACRCAPDAWMVSLEATAQDSRTKSPSWSAGPGRNISACACASRHQLACTIASSTHEVGR